MLVPIRTPFNIYLDFEVAPLLRRIAAWAIDIVVLITYGYTGGFLLHLIFGGFANGFNLLFLTLPMLVYHLVAESVFNGQSLGKKLMQLRVLSIEGGEPGIGQYLMRWIFRIWEWPIVFAPVAGSFGNIFVQVIVAGVIGIIVLVTIAVTNKGQRLGDLAAGTTVVNLRQQYSLSDTVFREVLPHNYKVLYPQVMKLSDRDINAIKSVIIQTRKSGRYQTAFRIAAKVKEVLGISNDDDVIDFLEKLLADYNYLATQE